MNSKENFIAYEYKSITVKQDSAALYADCLANFGWTQIDERGNGYGMASGLMNIGPNILGMTGTAVPMQTPPDKIDGLDMVTLKFKRNSRLTNKREIDKLERECEEALAAIKKLERNNDAHTMGASLGTGIAGTAFLALAVYFFSSASIVLGVLFTIIGIAGWGIGFLAHRKVGTKKTAQAEPMIQQHFDVVYNTCEQAHAMLA